MDFRCETRKSGECLCVVEGEMTIFHAADMKEQLFKALEEHPSLELNLENVTEFDSAGFQLLILLRKAAEKSGKQVGIPAVSQAVQELLALYRCTEFAT